MKELCPLVVAGLVASVSAFGDQACKSTVTGDLRLEHFQSKTYGGSVTLRVWLPAGYSDSQNSKAKYPTLYMLDGQNAFDECTAFHGEHELQIDEAVTRLISEHKIPPIVVIGIDSSSKRNYEYSPYRDPMSAPGGPEPIGKQLPSFLADEVFPFVLSRYRVTDDPAQVGIGGTSLGASAALYSALNHPELFRLALIESPNLILGNGQLLRDTEFIVRAPDRIAIGVGETEVHFPNIEQYLAPLGLVESDTDPGTVKMVETLVSHLKGAYFKRPDIMFVVQAGANHSSQFWAQRMPDAIEFLYRQAEPAR
ncbi:MAG: alpha/beta hydrolase [Acidobacteriaceae bacterium]|nr:alpha/beta hydrolase [Acidobacteriaceae bacterium]MBV9763949.1 alpha/beta hydrolase [Acidobacteriaceae bacterium]